MRPPAKLASPHINPKYFIGPRIARLGSKINPGTLIKISTIGTSLEEEDRSGETIKSDNIKNKSLPDKTLGRLSKNTLIHNAKDASDR